ncbi:hypothetical protein CEK25_006563 [Fusarium fujikuroi]|nr:hypothetical protein CEK25_006563 [Fusarium fujikuroi]
METGEAGDRAPRVSSVGPALVKAMAPCHLLLVAFAFTMGSGLLLMVSLGLEMAAYIPILVPFTSYGSFVDPTLVAMGWLYWFSPITFAWSLYAAGIIDPVLGLALALPYWISWALFTALNFVPVRIFGEY